MRTSLVLTSSLLSAALHLGGAERSLVPDVPSTAPDYYCTWNVQGFVCSNAGNTPQSDAMVEANLFGGGPLQGWTGFFPAVRGELYFVLDDTWDIPLGGDRRHPGRGSQELDAGRFPSYQGPPGQRLAAVSRAVHERGWRGLGLWIYSGRPKAGSDPRDDEGFWAERLGWAREAGIGYWKVDWGSMGTAEIWRLNRWANRLAPDLWVEHGALDRSGARIWQTDKLDIHRTYDVNAFTSIPETIRRIGQVVRYPRTDHHARGLINCEDEVVIGAALGCTYGVMRYPLQGDYPDGRPEIYFPAALRNLKRRMDEVTRAVRWHRIAQPFGTSASEAVDAVELPFEPDQAKSLSAPARIARGGLPLPEVRVNDGRHPPYVLCSRHPDGEIAIATVGRSLGARIPVGRHQGKLDVVITPADITLQTGALDRPVGIFGTYASLTLVTTSDLAGRRILAQDLAGTTPVDITDEVTVAKGRLIIPGAVIQRVGTMAGTPGDVSDPGLVLAVDGLTAWIPKPAMTPARHPAPPRTETQAGAALAISHAVWGPVGGGIDVTVRLADMIRNDGLEVTATTAVLGEDGGTDRHRRLHLYYSSQGQTNEVIVLEGERLSIDAHGVHRVARSATPAKTAMKGILYLEGATGHTLALARADDQVRLVLADATGKNLVTLAGPVSTINDSEYAVSGRNEATGGDERIEIGNVGDGVIKMRRGNDTRTFHRTP